MKTVQQIYSEYKIMPNLQLHQLRVAAVAKDLSENFNGELDKESITTACLFHDMGNIIKSDLSYFPEFVEPEGLGYWQKIKKEFIEKYGTEENIATGLIAKEIKLSSQAMTCLKYIGFSHSEKNEAAGSFESKICSYADMRVGPYGVISLDERFFEGRKRYAGKKMSLTSDYFEMLAQSMRNIEKQIFEKIPVIRPSDITDEKVKDIVKELRNLSFL